MFELIKKTGEIDFDELIHVYAESILKVGKQLCPNETQWEQRRFGESAFRDSIYDFFRTEGAAVALWCPDGRAVAALRLEPLADGILITCLETKPEARGKGCATLLLEHTLCHCRGKTVYVHILKNNRISLSVHRKVGFQVVSDFARLLDGTVSQNYYTLSCKKK